MTQIERRQTRIRRIKHRLTGKREQVEEVATSPDVHYHIGASQSRHEHIPTFVHEHAEDPAIRVGAFSVCLNTS